MPVGLGPWRSVDTVQSHRTMSRVKSMSSPGLILLMLVLSLGLAAIAVPYQEIIIVIASGFFISNSDKVMSIYSSLLNIVSKCWKG